MLSYHVHMFLPVEITDSHRNTVTTICRSSVFQSISELATSFSLSSIEHLGDECEGIFMYVCMQWLVLSLCVRRFSFRIGAVISYHLPVSTSYIFNMLLFCVLPVHQLTYSLSI